MRSCRRVVCLPLSWQRRMQHWPQRAQTRRHSSERPTRARIASSSPMRCGLLACCWLLTRCWMLACCWVLHARLTARAGVCLCYVHSFTHLPLPPTNSGVLLDAGGCGAALDCAGAPPPGASKRQQQRQWRRQLRGPCAQAGASHAAPLGVAGRIRRVRAKQLVLRSTVRTGARGQRRTACVTHARASVSLRPGRH